MSAGTPDPLLECLIELARFHGRAVSAEVVLSGLPMDSGLLRPSQFARAAQKAGLVAEIVQRPFSDIAPIVLPCIAFFRDQPVVLLKIDEQARRIRFVSFGAGRVEQEMALTDVPDAYSGCAIFVRPGHEGAGEAAAPQGRFGWFWSVILSFRSNYGHIAVASLILNVLALAFPLFVMAVYDRVVPNHAISSLVALTVGILISFTFEFLLRLARARMIDLTGKQADVVLASTIYEQVMNVRMGARPARVGILANKIRDFDSVREFFTSATLISVTDIFFAGIFIAVMFIVGGPLGWIPLALVPLVVLIGLGIQRPLDRALQRFQGEASAKHGLLVETLNGIETVKVIGAQASMQSAWERSVAASARAGEDVHRWSSVAVTLSNSAQQIASLMIMVAGVFLVLNNTLSVGALVAANMLSGRVLAPLANIAAMIAKANQTFIALRAIDEVMRLETDRPPGSVRTARHIESGGITFEQVSFSYPGATQPALRDVTFRIRPGERVGIVGKIGSGKTTVGRLLVNLHAPDNGRILLDGADQRQFDPIDLRRDIGFVLQESDLFMGTLRYNIALGRPGASDAEIIAAARLAGVDDFAAQHPDGYDMQIAEGGRSLSGGQRQSVALARVLLRKPKIMFLDEPTSALDTSSEAEFCRRLDSMLGRETTLLVCTHRVSLLGFVDRILVFDGGRLVADGPRDKVVELLGGRGPAGAGKPAPVSARGFGHA